MDEIIVTGTRLRVPQLVGTEPTVSVLSSRISERNASHFADTLNETPGYRGSLTPHGAQSSQGQGVNFINAFGLGSNRTLTLINGKRMVPSNGPSLFNEAAPGTQVDLNAIPTILVEKVDRVAIGGAPVYGSDAIAGTVNIHLATRMTGFKSEAVSGITGRGDKFRWRLAGAGGSDFAGGRGNFTAAVSYDRTDGISARDRSYLRTNIFGAPNPCSVFQPGSAPPSARSRCLALQAGRPEMMAGSIRTLGSMTASPTAIREPFWSKTSRFQR